MSVEFAQQTELARINKRACQTSTSMQTQSDEEELEETEEKEEQTPVASPTTGVWLEVVEKDRLKRELEERTAEIRKLKEALQKSESEQVSVGLLSISYGTTLIHFFHLTDFIAAVSLIFSCTVSQCRCCINTVALLLALR